MNTVLCVGLFLLICFLLAAIAMHNAPYGVEDETGFHRTEEP